MILFYKEPLLFNSRRLASGIRRENAAKLFLKLCAKCGYSTPITGELRTRSYFLSWFLFGTNCVGGESERSASQKIGLWPLAECWRLSAETARSDRPTCGAGWALGWREERRADQISQLWSEQWARMKKLLIKGQWTIRKATVTLQGEPGQLWQGGERAPSSLNGHFCFCSFWQQETFEAIGTSDL